MTASAQPARADVLALDVLRGMAAILMIVNHAGFRLLSASDAATSFSAAAVFLGGFAPVVFFFATGFGIALSTAASTRPPALGALLWKALLLVVADQFFYWRQGLPAGLDFFGFIALATVAVTLLARLRRSVPVCTALILVLLGVRYGWGPVLRTHPQAFGFADWVVGARAVDNVSYPLSPWMVYPLSGFVLGRLYVRVDSPSAPARDRWLRAGSVLMIGAFGVAALQAWRNSVFFRWGTVSAAYFVLSLGILAAVGLLSMVLAASHRRIAGMLALRGVASFAVIPAHYALLDFCGAVLALPVDPWAFAALVLVITSASFRVASKVSEFVSGASVSTRGRAWLAYLLLLLPVLASGTILGATHAWLPVAVLTLTGQLVVAALLGLRVPARATPRSAGAGQG